MFDLDTLRAPENTVEAVVPLDLDVGTNDRVAMSITDLRVYPTGFGFGFTALTIDRPGVVCADEMEVARTTGEDPIELQFHVGVEFADGRRADDHSHWIAANFPARTDRPRLASDPLTDITVQFDGVGPYDRRYSASGWVWPLPPPGPLTFWVAWPAAGVRSRPNVIDAATVLDAVGDATVLWETW